MTKRLLTVMAAVTAGLLLASCFVEYDPSDAPQSEPMGTFSGTETGESQGYTGSIKVTVTLANGYITKVDIDGPGDAASMGGEIIRQAPGWIEQANSFDIDALASASPIKFTKGAIKAAGKKALYQVTNGAYGSADGK
jgi:uncharacterized protein with FMN-binding domain